MVKTTNQKTYGKLQDIFCCAAPTDTARLSDVGGLLISTPGDSAICVELTWGFP